MRLNDRVIALALGAAMALGHAPFGLWFVSFAAMIILMVRFPASSGSGFGFGWWAGLGYFATALHWIVEPFLVDVARHGWMAPFALVFLAGGLALFWGGAFWATRRLASAMPLLALPVAWTLAELARSSVLTGFPWALVGYIWADTPVAQLAAFFGPHMIGWLTLGAAAITARLWVSNRIWSGLPLACLAAVWVLGAGRIPPQPVMTDTVVRLVQPNAAQHLKWRPEMAQTFFDRQIGFTSRPGKVDLVVWPEAAVPYLYGERTDLNELIASSAPGDAQIFMGIRKLIGTGETREIRNTAMALDAKGAIAGSYDKHHLVPFGEYLPFPSLFETFGLQALAAQAGRYTKGAGPRIMALPGIPDFQPLICYEAIFPSEILTRDQRPAWLLQITNDAWFGNFSGPYQHLDQARMRAIEQGLPLARSANTGVSAMIDPFGRVLDELPLNTEGYLDAALPDALSPTLYSRTGDTPYLIGLLALFASVVAFSRRVARAKALTRV